MSPDKETAYSGSSTNDTSIDSDDRWQPVITGTEAEEAWQTIDEIVTATTVPDIRWFTLRVPNWQDTREQNLSQVGLSRGLPGIVLLDSYLHQTGMSRPVVDDAKIRAEEQLDKLIDIAAGESLGITFFDGYCGIGWTMAHVARLLCNNNNTVGEEDPLESVDDLIDSYLVNLSDRKVRFELVGGLVGMGVYSLERLPSPQAKRQVEEIVRHLANRAEEGPQGITWRTDPQFIHQHDDFVTPDGYYNLGVAHGMPGVIGFLASVVAAGVYTEESRRLLAGAARWVLAHQLPAGSLTHFTDWFEPGKPKNMPTRIAWCYGDAGVALMLLNAARSLSDKDLEDDAMTIARHAAGQSHENTGAVDAGICHGAAGLAHIYNRIFQLTKDPELESATRTWFAKTLELRGHEHGIAGFKSFRPRSEEDTDPWIPEVGLLSGASGIALALLGCITDLEPNWDRAFLMSPLG